MCARPCVYIYSRALWGKDYKPKTHYVSRVVLVIHDTYNLWIKLVTGVCFENTFVYNMCGLVLGPLHLFIESESSRLMYEF